MTDRKGCEQSEMGLGVAPDNAKLIDVLIDAQAGLAPIHHDLEDEYYDMDLALGFG